MSEFIIRVMKWLASLVVAYFILFVLIVLILIGIGIAFEPVERSVEPGSVLVLDLGFRFTDQPESDDTATILRNALTGDGYYQISLREVLGALKRARNDVDIHGLLLTGNLSMDGTGGSLASLREFRQAITAFGREKPVYAFLQGDNLRDYYIKSAATEVISDPYAMVDFRGLRAERLYMGEAFEKIGIEVQVSAFEEFKTAAESFQRSDMSEAEREQLKSLIDDLWDSIVSDIAASRGLEKDVLNQVANTELLIYAEEVVETGFADTQMTEDLLIDRLVEAVGYDAYGESFLQFDFIEYAYMADPSDDAFDLLGSGNRVAILYVEGIMVDGEGDDGTIGSDTLNRSLRELRQDDSVKAVVLRINSPGGSATAAGRVVREVELTKRQMPVVVSMGGMAASGGYMLAALGDHVFTEPTTITGSIGVVSMLVNIEDLAEKLSLHFDGVETHPFAGSYSPARSKTEEEMRQIRALGAATYEEFLMLVSVNREMSPEHVQAVAKGRVWSGTAALEIGLADEEGGLMVAVQRAADLAGIGNDYTITDLPKPLSFEEKIRKFLMGARAADPQARTGHHLLLKDIQAEFKRLASLNDPHGQYAILPYTLTIR